MPTSIQAIHDLCARESRNERCSDEQNRSPELQVLSVFHFLFVALINGSTGVPFGRVVIVEEDYAFAVRVEECAGVWGVFEFGGFAEGKLGCKGAWWWHFSWTFGLSGWILVDFERESLYVEVFVTDKYEQPNECVL
ncbi:hypothetical protein GLAREA_11435 [Glarea lozoyensis ATCC 20868]|uniref:Uncharacterized protein n=1 Tax=Glarea lozoyensis (strain ATCC 20868 / MF5171) TaxID=1116229 RepID=S3CHW8_GLAL2|nr:uncharacterized protein GLAREA_11435 [Glarea lozoyensis ATCC 20868]EPE24854.1 hypothetical protein GLAREA_11435 [Glarea lozoyensis ATCC 20868]